MTEKLKFVLRRVETLWKKKKMVVTGIFYFSHNVFKRLHIKGSETLRLCGKEVNLLSEIVI